MTPEPCIITVAITGSLPRKKDNPAVPISVAEQVESTHEAYEAGATLAHIHVREDDESPSSEPARFAAVQDGIRKWCPDMVVQFSTGGRGRHEEERGAMLHLRPDMASLTTGSVNFPTQVYANPPDLIRDLAERMLAYEVKPEIEIFDLAMLYNAARLVEAGLLKEPVHVQFVLGIPGALPARRQVLEFGVRELQEMLPGASWTAAGIGRHQLTVNECALARGGHCRTGLEDNVRWDRERLAPSNAALVKRVAELAPRFGRRPATPTETRRLLGLA